MKRLADYHLAIAPVQSIGTFGQTDHANPRVARHNLKEEVPAIVMADEERVGDEFGPHVGHLGRRQDRLIDPHGRGQTERRRSGIDTDRPGMLPAWALGRSTRGTGLTHRGFPFKTG